MKIYIAGPITGHPNFREKFEAAEKKLREAGHLPMHSAGLPQGFEHWEYLYICDAMIDRCDAILMLPGWRDSKGAMHEFLYAKEQGKKVYFRVRELMNGEAAQ